MTGEPHGALKIRPTSVDMRSLTLSAEEGFVLSRIDSELGLSDLVALCGLEEARVVEIVQRLAAQGAVEVPGLPLPAAAADEDEFREPAPSFAGIDELGAFGDFGDEGGEVDATPLVLSICGVTHVGVVRTNNEDAFAVIDLTTGKALDVTAQRAALEVGPNGVLLAVSDGMGGQNAGEVASALTLEVIEKQLTASPPGDDVAAWLARAVEAANTSVTKAASAPGRTGMGATLIALLVHGEYAYSAEVGDSRAYALRRDRFTQISKDQTQIQVLLDQGLLTPEAAKTSHAKNIVLQAIGKQPEVVVAQRRLGLRNGDRLLLCSDGLTAHLGNDEIALILGSAPTLEEACMHLVEMTNDRGGKDNVTVVVAEVTRLAGESGAETVEQTLTTTRAFTVGEGP